MTHTTALGVLVALFSWPTQLPAQDPQPNNASQLPAKLRAYMEAEAEEHGFSGAALVAHDGRIVYQGAFGLANADWNIPNSLDIKFRVGSITKQFTAMLTLLLVQDGKLQLDATIGRYLPDFAAEIGDQVTIHQLLNHTSGLVDGRGLSEREQLHHIPVSEFVLKYCSDPLRFQPGTDYRYNHTGYYLLGAIIQAVTGQSYADALRERILDPLQMRDTGFADQNEVIERRATGYDEVLGERRVATVPEASTMFSAQGMHSTVNDLWKWDQALRSKQLMDGELDQRMFTPEREGYGYGWHIDRHGIWHRGVTPGFASAIGRLPARGQCAIVLTNTSGRSASAAALAIGQILRGEEPTPRTPRLEVPLAQTILAHGIEAGLTAVDKLPEAYRKWRMREPLNRVAEGLLRQRRFEEAIRIFEFNTRTQPDYAGTWDCLGMAHLAAGHRQLAIKNLRKALETTPSLTKTRKELERLEGS